ncbi:MAG TPA: CoA transferase [Dehalococcoidia bacterium]|nr:CoA transferase [Dehalococcoidia bacterium]
MSESSSPRALDGVRVIDLTHYISGPYCTKLLADYGADVIKIERPDGGDPARRLGPFYHDEPNLEGSGTFLHLNTNKRSVTLNLKTEAGRKALLALVRDADILVESFSPHVMPSLGLDYATLAAVNPRLVMTSISNFGQTGPYRDYEMAEVTLYAWGGTMISTGTADREPLKLGLTVEQVYAGMVCATATMGAFLDAAATGEGQHVDLSLQEIIVGNQDRAVQGHMIYQYTGGAQGFAARAGAGSPGRNLLPAGVYPTADGYVQFFTLQPHWERICRMIERPDLVEDEHFTAPENFSGNAEVKAEFDAILLEWLLQRTKREVMEASQAVGYPCGALNTMADVFDDPHLAARGFFAQVDHPYTGTLTYPGPQFRMSETPWRAGRAPLLGEHTREVLHELGYDDEDVTVLRQQGAI